MYSNGIQKAMASSAEARIFPSSFLVFLFLSRCFQRVTFGHARTGLPFVSACLFMKSHTVQARGGFKGRKRRSVSEWTGGLDIGSLPDMFM